MGSWFNNVQLSVTFETTELEVLGSSHELSIDETYIHIN